MRLSAAAALLPPLLLLLPLLQPALASCGSALGVAVKGRSGAILNVTVCVEPGEGRVTYHGPAGGPLYHDSIELAARTALLLLGVDPAKRDLTINVRSPYPEVAGTSLSLTVAMATLRALGVNLTVPRSAVATGTVNPDATVGFVGEVPAKLRVVASEEPGAVMLVPAWERSEYVVGTSVVRYGPFAFLNRSVVPRPIPYREYNGSKLVVLFTPSLLWLLGERKPAALNSNATLPPASPTVSKILRYERERLAKYIEVTSRLLAVKVLAARLPPVYLGYAALYAPQAIEELKRALNMSAVVTYAVAYYSRRGYPPTLLAPYMRYALEYASRAYYLTYMVVYGPVDSMLVSYYDARTWQAALGVVANSTVEELLRGELPAAGAPLVVAAYSVYSDMLISTRDLGYELTLALLSYGNMYDPRAYGAAYNVAVRMSRLVGEAAEYLILAAAASGMGGPRLPPGEVLSLLGNYTRLLTAPLARFGVLYSSATGIDMKPVDEAFRALASAQSYLGFYHEERLVEYRLASIGAYYRAAVDSATYLELHPGNLTVAAERLVWAEAALAGVLAHLPHWGRGAPLLLYEARLAFKDLPSRVRCVEESLLLAYWELMLAAAG